MFKKKRYKNQLKFVSYCEKVGGKFSLKKEDTFPDGPTIELACDDIQTKPLSIFKTMEKISVGKDGHPVVEFEPESRSSNVFVNSAGLVSIVASKQVVSSVDFSPDRLSLRISAGLDGDLDNKPAETMTIETRSRILKEMTKEKVKKI